MIDNKKKEENKEISKESNNKDENAKEENINPENLIENKISQDEKKLNTNSFNYYKMKKIYQRSVTSKVF